MNPNSKTHISKLGAAIAATIAATMSPKLFLTGLGFIVLGGVSVATAVATPVFVVGTTGVFVSAAVYHAFLLTKKSVKRGLGLDK